jgi:hypothetical protein
MEPWRIFCKMLQICTIMQKEGEVQATAMRGTIATHLYIYYVYRLVASS